MISLLRHLIRSRAMHKRVAAAIAMRRGEVVEHAGLRVDLGELAAGLAAIHRDADAKALLEAPADQLERAVRRLAIIALGPLPSGKVRVAGLLEITCDVCARRYPGDALRMHRRDDGFRIEDEGTCPEGHPLPALPRQVVVR